MANVKSFNLKQFSFLVSFLVLGAFSTSVKADINPQMINLNMQFKTKKKTLKSDLAMPFYQTAELENKFDDKKGLIEINPRLGKNKDEVAIEMKFYKSSGSKAYAKKEIIAKLGEESKVSVKGMTVRITPVL